MSFWTFLQIAVTWAGIVTVAIALGEVVLRAAERLVTRWQPATPGAADPSVTRFGLVLLIGLGAVGYVGVVLGLTRVFHPASLIAAGGVACAFGREGLLLHLRWLRAAPSRAWTELRAVPGAALLVLVAAVAYVMAGLTALAPPMAPDALHYHLPEAMVIADTHELPWTVGSPFFGNLPMLGEVLYAVGITFADLEISQVLHWTALGGLLLVVFGLVRTQYGLFAGAFAAAGIATFFDLTFNATTPMIDTLVLAFEISALLCVAVWVGSRRIELVAAAAVLLGLAMACKYTPAPTVLFVTGVVVVTLARRLPSGTAVRLGAALAGLGVVAGGYWYLKNLIHLGNPVYPFLFGHDGLTDAQAESAIAAVRGHSGDASDLGEFLRTPKEYLTPVALPQFLGFFVWPFALLVPKARSTTTVLVLYFVLYVPYWYFFATHEERFLMAAVAVGTILLAVVAGAIADRLSGPVLAVAGAACVAVLAVSVVRFGPDEAAKAVTKPPAFPGYFTGATSREDLLTRQFGCNYQAIERTHDLPPGQVLDDWTLGSSTSLHIYTDDEHRVVRITPLPRGRTAADVVRDRGIAYLFVNAVERQRLLDSDVPDYAERARLALATERELLPTARPVWSAGACRLYQLQR